MIYRGVVARVAKMDGMRIVGEDLRFIPLEAGEKLLAPGRIRLRVTAGKRGVGDPVVRERTLAEFEGEMVAIDAAGHDANWLYGYVNVAGKQP
jgi:hypothetical protein